MKSWLEVPGNRQAYNKGLRAYLTLREEGEIRITGGMIRQRVESCALFGRLLSEWREPSADEQVRNPDQKDAATDGALVLSSRIVIAIKRLYTNVL